MEYLFYYTPQAPNQGILDGDGWGASFKIYFILSFTLFIFQNTNDFIIK